MTKRVNQQARLNTVVALRQEQVERQVSRDVYCRVDREVWTPVWRRVFMQARGELYAGLWR